MILQKIWSYITFQKQPEFTGSENDKTGNSDIIDGDPDQEKVEDVYYLNEDGTRYTKPKSDGQYLRMMHGINRISILMFIIGMIIVMIKILK
jgi:hypothetical protein